MWHIEAVFEKWLVMNRRTGLLESSRCDVSDIKTPEASVAWPKDRSGLRCRQVKGGQGYRVSLGLAALGNFSRCHVSISNDCAINSRFRRHISILSVSTSARYGPTLPFPPSQTVSSRVIAAMLDAATQSLANVIAGHPQIMASSR